MDCSFAGYCKLALKTRSSSSTTTRQKYLLFNLREIASTPSCIIVMLPVRASQHVSAHPARPTPSLEIASRALDAPPPPHKRHPWAWRTLHACDPLQPPPKHPSARQVAVLELWLESIDGFRLYQQAHFTKNTLV